VAFRTVLVARLVEEMSVEETADLLGCGIRRARRSRGDRLSNLLGSEPGKRCRRPQTPGRSREEAERRQSRRAGATLVRDNRQTQVANTLEIEA
jgi:hypothetical protein